MQGEQRLLGCILTGHTHVMQSHVAITVICTTMSGASCVRPA